MGGPQDQPLEIVAVLLFDETDRETMRQQSDDAADAGPDRQRHSDLRLHVSRDGNACSRHVDDEAAAGRAVGEGQCGMRACRDDPRVFPGFADGGILLLVVEPGELGCELLAHGGGHGEFEQEAAGSGVADVPVELAEIAEIGGDAIADLADHRHGDHHPERRNAAGPAREGAWLSPRVKPVRKRVMAAYGDVDSLLTEKLLDRHGGFPCVSLKTIQ
jgi:hypothetical protein